MKKRKWMLLIFALALLISGCSISPQPSETSSSVCLTDDEVSSPNIAASGESEPSLSEAESEHTEASESDQQETAVDSAEKEFLLQALWVRMLQLIDIGAPKSENDSRWDRTYEVEAYLADFTLDTFKYRIGLVYPEQIMSTYVYYWPDFTTDVREVYQTADEWYAIMWGLSEKRKYEAESDWISKRDEESILQTTGWVTNEVYEQANLFIDKIQSYNTTAYELWGSVLQVAGKLYQESTGTILGNLTGKAVMTDLNLETPSGTYWICLDGIEPVQVTITYLNKDCGVISFEVNEEAVLDEDELEAGWIGMQFDLVTTRK